MGDALHYYDPLVPWHWLGQGAMAPDTCRHHQMVGNPSLLKEHLATSEETIGFHGTPVEKDCAPSPAIKVLF